MTTMEQITRILMTEAEIRFASVCADPTSAMAQRAQALAALQGKHVF